MNIVIISCLFFIGCYCFHPTLPIEYDEEVIFENENCTGDVIWRKVVIVNNCLKFIENAKNCSHHSLHRCAAGFADTIAMPNYIHERYSRIDRCDEKDEIRKASGWRSGCYPMYMNDVKIGSMKTSCSVGSQISRFYSSMDCTSNIRIEIKRGRIALFDECSHMAGPKKWHTAHCENIPIQNRK